MQIPIGSKYYSGKNLLITGATGLVGKSLIEAILRKLPEVRRIYVVIRPRTDDAGNRLPPARALQKEIIESSAFDYLREFHGDGFDEFVRQRIHAVEGDLSKDRLGMYPGDYELLGQEVDIVINSAALAVFDAPLDQLLHTNTLGPRRILEFARNGLKRPYVAHISTCYVNNIAGPIFEVPLDPCQTPNRTVDGKPFDVDDEVAAIQEQIQRIRTEEADRWLRRRGRDRFSRLLGRARNWNFDGSEEDFLSELREEWIERRLVQEGLQRARRWGWKDTYTFTKSMGEQQFIRHKGDVAGFILRPSIIESALRTPAPGWIDGFRMIDPVIVGYGRGQFQDFPGNPESVLDLVPVDTVVNALLMAIPWTHAGKGSQVYHVASGMEKPLRLKQLREYILEYFEKNPLRRGGNGNGDSGLLALTFPEVRHFLRRLDYKHLLPLRILERLCAPLKITKWGWRMHADLGSRRAKIERLRGTAAIYGPYAESQARFLTFNLRAMWNGLPADDRAKFPFVLHSHDWKRYLQETHVPGIERYLLRMARRLQDPPVDIGVNGHGDSTGSSAAENAFTTDAAHDDNAAWIKAHKLFALTADISVRDVDKWTTPTCKKITQRLSAGFIRMVCRHRLELKVVGREHIPERGPFIVVSNHSSHVDTGVLLAALGPLAEKVHPTAAADYWFRSPVLAWALHATLGAIPFDRHARNIPRSLALPAQVLRNGHSLIFYPEGTRSTDGKMHSFNSTVGLLALASGATILPARIIGSAQALPKGKSIIRHHPVQVRFGASISVEPYLGRLDRESVAAVARELTRDLQEAVVCLADPREISA